LNGGPFIHPDTLGYFRAGEHTIQALESVFARRFESAKSLTTAGGSSIDARGDHFAPERSVYYGAFVVAMFYLGGGWAIIIAQSLITSAILTSIIELTLPIERSIWLAVALITCLISGISIFVCTIMPDIFCGLLILAEGAVLAYGARIPRRRVFLFYAVIIFAMLTHTTHIAVSIVIISTFVVFGIIYRHLNISRAAPVIALTVCAIAANALVNFSVEHFLKVPVIQKPFLLARLLSDGPVATYLDEHCATNYYALCQFRGRLHESGNDILWSTNPKKGVIAISPIGTQTAIAAQSSDLILAAIRERPIEQLRDSIWNFASQMMTVGVVEYNNINASNLEGISQTSAFFGTAARYVRHTSPFRAVILRISSVAMTACYMAGFVYLVFYTAISIMHSGTYRPAPPPAHGGALAILVLLVLVGCSANALICGVLSGVFDRYQGRVAWVVVFLALAVIGRVVQAKTPANRAAPTNLARGVCKFKDLE
jgi:MFS family permease